MSANSKPLICWQVRLTATRGVCRKPEEEEGSTGAWFVHSAIRQQPEELPFSTTSTQGGGAHRGAAAAAAATGGAVPQGGRLGHGEGGQAPGLAVAAVALQLSSPLLAWGQDGFAIG